MHGIDAEFFAGTEIKSNFLCTLGHGDPMALARAVRGWPSTKRARSS